MNPLTNVKNITKLNELELARGTVDKKSWHDMYKDSAWIFVGGLAYGLTEGDILSVFSQYGEIVNINLIRDAKTGKIKGFCFLCYANQKSTVLAVDNFNGIKLCGRTIRVDHVSNYKPPKERETDDDLTKQLKNEGCAPKAIKVEDAQPSTSTSESTVEKKKSKKAKKEKKKHKKKRKHESNKETKNLENITVKEEKIDPGYTKHELPPRKKSRTRKEQVESSSDSESSSSDSDSLDSNSLQLSKKKESNSKHKTKSGQSSREKYDSHNSSKSRALVDAEMHKKHEKITSSRDGFYESDKQQKRLEDDKESFRSKSFKPSDRDRKRKHDEDNFNDRSDSYKKKHSAEYNTYIFSNYENELKVSSSKHQRHDSSSRSDSDSDQEKGRVRGKEDDRYKKSHFDYERSSKSHKSYEDIPRRDDRDFERKSRHDRDRR